MFTLKIVVYTVVIFHFVIYVWISFKRPVAKPQKGEWIANTLYVFAIHFLLHVLHCSFVTNNINCG